MQKYLPYAVLLLRLALAVTFLATIADKMGYWGKPGTNSVIWGNWDNYTDAVSRLLFFLPAGFSGKLAIAFTLLEIIVALMLLFGLKVRWAAIGTAVYTLLLAVLITLSLGLKELLNQSVLVTAAAALLLACCPIYKFTLNGIKKRSTHFPY